MQLLILLSCLIYNLLEQRQGPAGRWAWRAGVRGWRLGSERLMCERGRSALWWWKQVARERGREGLQEAALPSCQTHSRYSRHICSLPITSFLSNTEERGPRGFCGVRRRH